MKKTLAAAIMAGLSAACAPDANTTDKDEQMASDPYLWLEDVDSERALNWVRGENERTLNVLQSDPQYEALYAEALAILASDERIPYGKISGGRVYNFWRDDTHVRGIWRRAPLASYLNGAPSWETLLDIDALASAENENWVWGGADCLPPDDDKCLILLSRGGTDAKVAREFSLTDKAFVADGFAAPEAKSWTAWLDGDTLLIATDWGEGSLTTSGYPRIVKRWRRGTPLNTAETVFEGETSDVWALPTVKHAADGAYAFIIRGLSFFESETFPMGPEGVAASLPLPRHTEFKGAADGKAFFVLNEDWSHQGTDHPKGALVAYDLNSGAAELVFAPKYRQSIAEAALAKSDVFIELLDVVVGKALRLRRSPDGWVAQEVPLPDNGVVSLVSASGDRNEVLLSFESPIVPDRLIHVSEDNAVRTVDAVPDFYDASDVAVEQRFARSADGTEVPYFVMGRRGVLASGGAPTIQYGYGGFLIPILPNYLTNPGRPQDGALAGKMWISRGGVLALANIRGGGEFGPGWHAAALKENRQRAFDDFFAVSEALIDTGLAAPDKLGAIGRSNGGLLMGAALTQRPELYKALDIGVPLLDMLRYHKLLAGASWVGEYGDPDVREERAFLEAYSPYQKLEAGKPYPRVFFYTSTKDDRVHPGHARKAAAKLNDLGYETYYYENIEGGHGGTANQEQLAMRTALEYVYFMRELMGEAAP